MAPYLSHHSQFFLHVVNLVGFKPQGHKNEQEQHQHDQGHTGAHSHAAPALPMSPRPVLGRWEGPAGYKVWWLCTTTTSTSIHKEHLWERVGLVTAHGAGPAVRQTACASVTSARRRCVLVWEPLTFKTKLLSRYSPPTKPSHTYHRLKTSAHY